VRIFSRTSAFLRLPRPPTVSLRELDAPARQERARAVGALLAVHVGRVVVGDAERPERFARPAAALLEIGVEHLLPRGGVDGRGLREDTVEVEKAGGRPRGETHRGGFGCGGVGLRWHGSPSERGAKRCA
jgi:hypothetical protein